MGDSCASGIAGLVAFSTALFALACEEQAGAHVALLSPLVVSTALSMVAAGATEGSPALKELLSTLGIARHEEAAEAVAKLLPSPSQGGVAVLVANAVFSRQIKPSFVELLQQSHGRPPLNSTAGPLGDSYEPINAWVSRATDGLVGSLLDGAPDPLTRAFLVSAVYFKGSWASRFDAGATKPGVFRAADGEHLPARFMHRTGSMAVGHVDGLGATVLRLDYADAALAAPQPAEGGGEYCALLMLPTAEGDEGTSAVVRGLAQTPPSSLLAALARRPVALSLPKLRAEWGSTSLVGALRQLGLASAFDADGQFLPMSDDPTLHLSDVVSRAVLEMDEQGTTAAAAAAAVMKIRSMRIPPPPLELSFDRPFVMAIVHAPSGVPLFLGRFNRPQLPS